MGVLFLLDNLDIIDFAPRDLVLAGGIHRRRRWSNCSTPGQRDGYLGGGLLIAVGV